MLAEFPANSDTVTMGCQDLSLESAFISIVGRKLKGACSSQFACLLEDRFVGGKEKATLQENVLKVFTGILGFLVLRLGLKIIFPDQGFFHILRYALAGPWVASAAPWVFVKMGWGDYPGDAG